MKIKKWINLIRWLKTETVICCLRMTSWSRLGFPLPLFPVLLDWGGGCSTYFFALFLWTCSLVVFWKSFWEIFEFFSGYLKLFPRCLLSHLWPAGFSVVTFCSCLFFFLAYLVCDKSHNFWIPVHHESHFITVTDTISSIVDSLLFVNQPL